MFDFDQFGSAFVDMRLHRLRVLITEQSDALFAESGLKAPSSCVSVLLFLKAHKQASIVQISDRLGYSHQLIAHRLKLLDNLGLTAKFADMKDRRRALIKLTAAGLNEASKIERLLPEIAKVFDELSAEFSVNLSEVLDSIRGELVMNSLSDRVLGTEDTRSRA